MAQIIKPDTIGQTRIYTTSVFLAGSIEMGIAQDWQSLTEGELKDFPITIYNPRRDSWDSSWEQRESNPSFKYQVNWELDKLDEADLIFLYLDPKTKSPVSLLELGIHSRDKKLIVCCPDGFWRKGNVEIVCQRMSIPLFNSLDDALHQLKVSITSRVSAV